MKRLIETFLAEDITGNQYRIHRYHKLTRRLGNAPLRTELLEHNGTPVTHQGDDIYYIASIDTEVKKSTSNKQR